MNNPIQTPQSSTSQPNAQEISIKDKSSSNREMSRRVKENCRALLDNFTEIIRLSKIEEASPVTLTAKCAEETFQMNVRATSMVRAAESLLGIVQELKLAAVLGDVKSLNESLHGDATNLRQNTGSLIEASALSSAAMHEPMHNAIKFPSPPTLTQPQPPLQPR